MKTLYTSLTEEGALAEIGFRVFKEPVLPDRPHNVHVIRVRTEKTSRIEEVADLAALGVDIANYADADYASTQRIAAIAHREFAIDSMIVRSARWDCLNLVLFVDRLDPDPALEVTASRRVDWAVFRTDFMRSAR